VRILIPEGLLGGEGCRVVRQQLLLRLGGRCRLLHVELLLILLLLLPLLMLLQPLLLLEDRLLLLPLLVCCCVVGMLLLLMLLSLLQLLLLMQLLRVRFESSVGGRCNAAGGGGGRLLMLHAGLVGELLGCELLLRGGAPKGSGRLRRLEVQGLLLRLRGLLGKYASLLLQLLLQLLLL